MRGKLAKALSAMNPWNDFYTDTDIIAASIGRLDLLLYEVHPRAMIMALENGESFIVPYKDRIWRIDPDIPDVIIKSHCPVTGEPHQVKIALHQLYDILLGTSFIQKILPHEDANTKEFFITGFSNKDWDITVPESEEDNE